MSAASIRAVEQVEMHWLRVVESEIGLFERPAGTRRNRMRTTLGQRSRRSMPSSNGNEKAISLSCVRRARASLVARSSPLARPHRASRRGLRLGTRCREGPKGPGTKRGGQLHAAYRARELRVRFPASG